MKNVRRWGRVSRIGDRLYPYRVTRLPRWVEDWFYTSEPSHWLFGRWRDG